jgi:hypothetical protein
MAKKYKPGDPELEKYRVKEEDLPSNFGETVGKLAVQMYLNPMLLAHAEGTILGLEFRLAELKQENFYLSARFCEHLHGDEHGHETCKFRKELKMLRDAVVWLGYYPEVLEAIKEQ